MGYTPGPGMGGGWGPPGVYTSRHGFKRGTKEYSQSKVKYHSLRYQYAGRSPFDAMKIGYWKTDAASRSPRYWKEYQKLVNYIFMGMPGKMGKGKLAKTVKMVQGSRQFKQLRRIAGSSKTQKQLEKGMGLKKTLDKKIVRTNPVRSTRRYKTATRVDKSRMDGAYLTVVYGGARLAWTAGGSAFTSKVLGLGKKFIRKERY